MYCNVEFVSNWKSQIYCSKKCCSQYLWRKNDKNRKMPCPKCGTIMMKKAAVCKSCHSISNNDITLQDAIYTKHHKSAAFSLVRWRARAVVLSIGVTKCQGCGYDKHFEVAHRKPIASYSLDTKLSVINDLSNLLALCPNCHWELDHNLRPELKELPPVGNAPTSPI